MSPGLPLLLALGLLPVATSSASPPAPSEPVAVVSSLYREFAWEAVMTEPEPPGQGLLEQPREVLLRYFEAALVELILRDRREAGATREIGRLDFLPIWDSQDPAASDLKVVDGPSPGSVTVTFRYPGRDAPVRLVYRMRRTPGGWRIADIEYASGHSLSEILQGGP